MTRRSRTPTASMPLVIAHRGDSWTHPENTLPALLAAAPAGADGVEFDVRMCADAAVVAHDGTLARFGGSQRPLGRTPLAELRRADVGAWKHPRFRATPVPTLGEALDAVPAPLRLMVELKPSGSPAARLRLVRDAVDAVARRRLHARASLLCFDLATLRLARRRDPRLRLVLNCERPPRLLPLLARLGVAAVDCDWRTLTPAAAARVRAAGLGLFTYTVDDLRGLSVALACGVDGIITDRPAWLRGRLARRIR